MRVFLFINEMRKKREMRYFLVRTVMGGYFSTLLERSRHASMNFLVVVLVEVY